MKTHRTSLVIVAILIGSSILACNFSKATLNEMKPPVSTLAPPPAAEFQLEDIFSESPYIVEEFETGMPENFNADPGWQTAAGILSVRRPDAILEIPGDWQEFRLILRMRVGSGRAAIDFNISPIGVYRLNVSSAELELLWLPPGADSEVISTHALDLTSGWHNLVLTQKQGNLSVNVDGETLMDSLNPDYSPSGYFRISESGNGTLEIDRFVIGPPE